MIRIWLKFDIKTFANFMESLFLAQSIFRFGLHLILESIKDSFFKSVQ